MSRSAVFLHDFRRLWSLSLCNKLLQGNINYSYNHETLQQRSLIDYFLIPDSCWLTNYHILDLPFNLSDHLAVEISLRCYSYSDNQQTIVSAPAKPTNNFVFRDWNLQNKRSFYDNTRCRFININDRTGKLLSDSIVFSNSIDVADQIESIYTEMVGALHAAAEETVPAIKANLRKPWWDDTLSTLKELSIQTHTAWVDAGRPPQGTLFLEKQKAKLQYKKQIAENKIKSQFNLSDSLQNRLLDNDQISFWKIWRKNFGAKVKVSNCIDGLSDSTCIANKFADIFSNTCKPNNSSKTKLEAEKENFMNRLAH